MDSRDLIHNTLKDLRAYHELLGEAIDAVEAVAKHAPRWGDGPLYMGPAAGAKAQAIN